MIFPAAKPTMLRPLFNLYSLLKAKQSRPKRISPSRSVIDLSQVNVLWPAQFLDLKSPTSSCTICEN